MAWLVHEALGSRDPLTPARIARMAGSGELFIVSLEPEIPGPHVLARELPRFHGWLELGRTEIADATRRRQLLTSLAADRNQSSDAAIAACFWPRHGVHWQLEGDELDLVICFQCHQVQTFPARAGDSFLLNHDNSQKLLDLVLTLAGVPLAEKPPT